jgi:hypothetical protein
MQYIIARFLESSHIDPVYFVTLIVDVVAVFLWFRLKRHLPTIQRSLHTAIIIVAIVLTAGVLFKYFGVIKDWKELRSLWKY